MKLVRLFELEPRVAKSLHSMRKTHKTSFVCCSRGRSVTELCQGSRQPRCLV